MQRGFRVLIPSTKVRKFAVSAEVEKTAASIAAGNRFLLSKAITLIESTRDDYRARGHEILNRLLEIKAEGTKNVAGFRIGISGPPGVGKSTFIESLGKAWLQEGLKIAVIAVDPSSHLSGGAILGDKTRMNELSMDRNAFIRPCSSGGALGGLSMHTDEVVQLCEAAGYDVVLVETVGVGQSEVLVTEVADLSLLLLPPAGGDELQGIKRGIVETADIIVVNKADGDLIPSARRALAEYKAALSTVRAGGGRPLRTWWEGAACMCSSKDGSGIDTVLNLSKRFWKLAVETGALQQRRGEQRASWMWRKADSDLIAAFRADPAVQARAAALEADLRAGSKSSRLASRTLIDTFLASATAAAASSPAAAAAPKS